MRKRKQCISTSEATPRKQQHTQPCTDCPFARTALRGWLGGCTPEEYLALAHGDEPILCHATGNQQCAGAAVYRANVGKHCRERTALKLAADREEVFATPMEFLEHHERE